MLRDEIKNPIKTLRRAVEANDERGEVMPCSLADLAAAREALGQVETVVALLEEMHGGVKEGCTCHICAALGPFQVEP